MTALIMTIPGYFVIPSPLIVPSSMTELLGSISLILSGSLIATMNLSPAKEYLSKQELKKTHST